MRQTNPCPSGNAWYPVHRTCARTRAPGRKASGGVGSFGHETHTVPVVRSRHDRNGGGVSACQVGSVRWDSRSSNRRHVLGSRGRIVTIHAPSVPSWMVQMRPITRTVTSQGRLFPPWVFRHHDMAHDRIQRRAEIQIRILSDQRYGRRMNGSRSRPNERRENPGDGVGDEPYGERNDETGESHVGGRTRGRPVRKGSGERRLASGRT